MYQNYLHLNANFCVTASNILSKENSLNVHLRCGKENFKPRPNKLLEEKLVGGNVWNVSPRVIFVCFMISLSIA